MRLPVLFAASILLGCPFLSAQTYGVAVTPHGQVVSNKTAHTGGHTQVFRVTNEGTAAQTFQFTCIGASGVICTGLSSSSETINGNSFKNITATYSVGNSGTGQLIFTASGPQSTDQGSITIPVVLLAGAPRMSVLPYLDAKQDYGRCALNCFAASFSHTTIPYFSLDQPRAVTLVYNGDRVAPRPFVLVNVWPDSSFGTFPTEYQLEVKVNGAFVKFDTTGVGGTGPGPQTIFFTNPASKLYRIGGQFTPTGLQPRGPGMDDRGDSEGQEAARGDPDQGGRWQRYVLPVQPAHGQVSGPRW